MSSFAPQIRRLVLEESRRADVGHIGSSLCVAEILSVLYSRVLKISSPEDRDRDRFILSKGHAALALYAALHLKGWMTRETLATYCADDSLLGTHPEHALTGVDFSTGSLGQGLSFGAGAAMAARLQNSKRNVYVLVSDAECNEGSLWEAVMFAAHQGLSNLTAIVDLNGQQALGHTRDVLDLSPMRGRWQAFGWDAVEADGHNEKEMERVLSEARTGAPRVLIAKTVFGKGVPYMENKVKWHYSPMTDEEYRTAIGGIRGS